jgi:hypothetical protein
MAVQPDHQRLITEAAKRVLKPAGLVQKGRSRIWLDDHGWCVVQVEFQPMTGSRGSALNVGVCWLWAPSSHLSFDWGYRQGGFIEYRSEEQFGPAADKLARDALTHVATFRRQLVSAADAVRGFEAGRGAPDQDWSLYYRACLRGLAGDLGTAKYLLTNLIDVPTEHDWETQRRRWAERMLAATTTAEAFRRCLTELVVEARRLNDLPEWEGALLPPEAATLGVADELTAEAEKHGLGY